MVEHYTHHIGGGGFSINCDLELDTQNNLLYWVSNMKFLEEK